MDNLIQSLTSGLMEYWPRHSGKCQLIHPLIGTGLSSMGRLMPFGLRTWTPWVFCPVLVDCARGGTSSTCSRIVIRESQLYNHSILNSSLLVNSLLIFCRVLTVCIGHNLWIGNIWLSSSRCWMTTKSYVWWVGRLFKWPPKWTWYSRSKISLLPLLRLSRVVEWFTLSRRLWGGGISWNRGS